MVVNLGLQLSIWFCIFGLGSVQEIFQTSLSLNHGQGNGLSPSLDYTPSLSYQYSGPDVSQTDQTPSERGGPVVSGQMLEVPVYVLMPDSPVKSQLQKGRDNRLKQYSQAHQEGAVNKESYSHSNQPFSKPAPLSNGYADSDQVPFDPFGMLLEQRTHARQAPYGMGHSSQQLFQPVQPEANYPMYDNFGQTGTHNIHHSAELHRGHTNAYQPPATQTFGFLPPTQPQPATGAGFYQNPQPSNQIQIYPPKPENLVISAPVSSSANSYVSYQVPNEQVQQYNSIPSPSPQHISVSNAQPYQNTVNSYQQANTQQPFSHTQIPQTATIKQPPKKRNIKRFLGAILNMLKYHMPPPPMMHQPLPFPMRHYPMPPLASHTRRPSRSNYYRKTLPKKTRHRKRKKKYRSRKTRQRIPRYYGRKSRGRYEDDTADDNMSVLGEDVYDSDADVFDMDITEDGGDYSVLEDADIYDSDYEEEY